jgi:uncharacterized membrane protein
VLNPFDLKTVILAKHAQHVVLIHFPIALFITSVAFDLLAYRTRRPGFGDAAYYNLFLAAISTVPVLATGLLAWQFQLEGQKLKGVLLLHLVKALSAVAPLPSYRFLFESLTVVLIILTAHLGGFLSGVNNSG